LFPDHAGLTVGQYKRDAFRGYAPHIDRRWDKRIILMKRIAEKDKIAREEAIEQLNLFIEKAELLRLSSFVTTRILNQEFKLDIEANLGTTEWSIKSTDIDLEQLDAFLLTMRLFIQNNERISICRTAELIGLLNVSEGLKERFLKNRDLLNNFLNSKSSFSIHGDRPTYKEVMDTVLYGNHGHLSLEKRRRYKKWTAGPFGPHIVYLEFIWVLRVFIQILVVLDKSCQLIVKELIDDIPKDGQSGELDSA
jgi:hypothetical protein